MDWDTEADSYCVNCRGPIYFGEFKCPACGKDPDNSDEQLAESKRFREEEARKMDTDSYWIEQMSQNLDSEIMFLEMKYVDIAPGVSMPEGACDKAKQLIEGLKNLKEQVNE